MVYGIGTDICQIGRIGAALERHGVRFAEKLLGPQELATYHERCARHPLRGVRYLATRFAAKEAFSKAIGLGLQQPMSWHAAQTLNAPGGQPLIVCGGALEHFMQSRRLKAQVTISDEADYAVAFVIVEQST